MWNLAIQPALIVMRASRVGRNAPFVRNAWAGLAVTTIPNGGLFLFSFICVISGHSFRTR